MSKKSNSGTLVIERRMHRSAAFRKLSANSIFVLFEFLSRRTMIKVGRKGRWTIANNGEIVFPYAEAEGRFGIFRSTFCRSISQLVEFGFIDITHTGGNCNLLDKCSKYSVSERWREYGREGFIKKSRPKDTRGLGFTKKNWKETAGKRKKKIGTTSDTRSSITRDTSDHQMSVTPSITNATHNLALNYHYLNDLSVFKAMHLPSITDDTIL